MKKILAFSLLICLLVTTLAACGGKGGEGGETTPPQTEEISIPLPEPKEEFVGQEFTILYRDTYDYEWVFMEEEAGTTLNDAVFKRNTAVEERYGVFINPYKVSNLDFEQNFLLEITKSISAGDDTFQLAAGMEYRLAYNSVLGDFLDWYSMPGISINESWWDGGFAEAASYNNHVYVMTGSLSLSHLYSSSCVFFNQDIINAQIQNGAEQIYQQVWDGEWTLAAFEEYVAQFTHDIGDAGWDENDAYGYATNVNTGVDAFIFSCEIPLSQRGENGEITLLAPDEKFDNLTKTLNRIINTSGNTFIQDVDNALGLDVHIGMMLKGNTAFTTSYLKNASRLRTTEINYGILPYPKWDKAQQQYHSITMDFSSALAIPRTAAGNAEFVGTIAEAMAYYSHIYVRDALYDTVLKYRDAKDVNSSKCIDIILDNPRYDFVYVYAFSWGDQQGPSALLRTCIKSKQPFIIKAFDSSEKRFNSSLTKLLTNFK